MVIKKTICYFCDKNKLCSDSWDKNNFVCEDCYNKNNLSYSDKKEFTYEDEVNLWI